LGRKDRESGVAATAVALALAYIAHYDFGISREEIRAAALIGAGFIVALVAGEFFAKRMRRLKLNCEIACAETLFSQKIPQTRQLNYVVRR
jgi:hypothetical protein